MGGGGATRGVAGGGRYEGVAGVVGERSYESPTTAGNRSTVVRGRGFMSLKVRQQLPRGGFVEGDADHPSLEAQQNVPFPLDERVVGGYQILGMSCGGSWKCDVAITTDVVGGVVCSGRGGTGRA